MFIERRELDKNNNDHVKQPFNNEATVPSSNRSIQIKSIVNFSTAAKQPFVDQPF